MLTISHKLDLAIIQPLKPHDTGITFLKFANEEDIRVGMETISISHSGGFVYILTIGHISYPCRISPTPSDEPRNINRPIRLPCDIVENLKLANISDDLKPLQLK